MLKAITHTLVLSSTSFARKTLLERLQVPFKTVAPNIDETPFLGETPRQLVKRLAKEKACVHAGQFANALIIGCDQVAVLEDTIVSKPGSYEEAIEQLSYSSGKIIYFYTGLCLYNTATRRIQLTVEPIKVVYRAFSQETIRRYLEKDQPYHCAGSIKSEGLGIALFEKVITKDPSALTGLPLIKLVSMLQRDGFSVI